MSIYFACFKCWYIITFLLMYGKYDMNWSVITDHTDLMSRSFINYHMTLDLILARQYLKKKKSFFIWRCNDASNREVYISLKIQIELFKVFLSVIFKNWHRDISIFLNISMLKIWIIVVVFLHLGVITCLNLFAFLLPNL